MELTGKMPGKEKKKVNEEKLMDFNSTLIKRLIEVKLDL